jgi:hypothetical protein
VLPPVLFVRWLRGTAQSVRRLALTVGPEQADATGKLLKVGAAALAVTAVGGGALEIAKPAHHAAHATGSLRRAAAPSTAGTAARHTGSLRGRSVAVEREHTAAAVRASASASTPAGAPATLGASASSSAAAKPQTATLRGLVATGLSDHGVSPPLVGAASGLGTMLTGTVAGATGDVGQIVQNVAKPVVSTVGNVVAVTVTPTVPTVGASGSAGLAVAGG